MKNKFKLTIGLLSFTFSMFGSSPKHTDYSWTTKAIETSAFQLKQMADELKDRKDSLRFPRSIRNGKIRLEVDKDWTSGFYPGSLWLGYELTGDKKLQKEARVYTNLLVNNQYYTGTHDLGFMMYCSYGNALRLAPEKQDESVIVNSAKSLCTRFNPKTNVIRSWDFGKWSYPVIIDNMMNLEMLFWASKKTGDNTYRDIAVKHADVTMKNHFRPDMSSYHVISYNPQTGDVESKGTFQGYADNSAWARGQAWGLYGYTLCYRETGDKKYLERAEAIAKFIMNNPSIPKDLIPYWDYNAPDIPNAPRDVSAATVTASALLELSTFASKGSVYADYAEKILKNLTTDKYLAKKGTNKGFILMHSVGHLPAKSEIDTPLNYADYYYLESIKRYLALKGIDTKSLLAKKN